MPQVISGQSGAGVIRVPRPRQVRASGPIAKFLEFWWKGWRYTASALGREGIR